ncbi:MAG: hypothetical protein M1820_010821 [Bogoriella megaspora]|nr:MAG: hypothetical protein M1820_010821 [Bogoriella megaspora]
MSDVENSEPPVREQLKNTSIAPVDNSSESSPGSGVDTPASPKDNQEYRNVDMENGQTEPTKLRKKRSFEDVEKEEDAQGHPIHHHEKHVRKRSRSREPEKLDSDEASGSIDGTDVTQAAIIVESEGKGPAKTERALTPVTTTEVDMQDEKETVTSPTGKRNREAFQNDHKGDKRRLETETSADLAEDGKADNTENSGTTRGEPKTKKSRDSSSPKPETKEITDEPASKVPLTSGFANTSATSPFGALAGNKSPTRSKSPTEPPQTSTNAFSKSGFAALSGSQSPFGSLGASGSDGTKSPFGATSTSQPIQSVFGTGKPLTAGTDTLSAKGTGFNGGTSNKSPFAIPGMTKLSTFGTGLGTFGPGEDVGTRTFGSKPTPAFGAPVEGDDDPSAEEGEDGEEAFAANEEDKQDERFSQQELNTGEDQEITRFQSRAKLYAFMPGDNGDERQWKERGFGNLKLNVSKPDTEKPDEPLKARLILRADGSQRVLLNSPVLKDIKFGDVNGDKPEGMYVLFRGPITGMPGLEPLQLRLRQANALELWQQVTDIQAEMD